MKTNCDGPSDDEFDPGEALIKWLISGPGGRHVAGHKMPVPAVSVLSATTATATASCQSQSLSVVSAPVLDVK